MILSGSSFSSLSVGPIKFSDLWRKVNVVDRLWEDLQDITVSLHMAKPMKYIIMVRINFSFTSGLISGSISGLISSLKIRFRIPFKSTRRVRHHTKYWLGTS